jgi:hypothetical protein
MKILPFLFGGFIFSSYLCHRYNTIVCLSSGATVIAYGFIAAGFFYA